MRHLFLFFLLSLIYWPLSAQQLFVNTATGHDTNPGSREKPLKTLREAARRVNNEATLNASEIVLSEGVYVLAETALFKNNRPYTATSRLRIRAEVLPDDPVWHPERMPTIVTAVPLTTDESGETGNGIQIEANHVTIQGLRFTGGFDYYHKSPSQIRRTYPIRRDGKALDDLVVTQCVFIGDKHILPLHVGVIANGHGLVVDHCIFYNVKNPVVFWQADGGTSYRNAMRNCLVYGAEFSGVWTVQTDGDDFDFRNNIITRTGIAWVREKGGTRHYKVINSLFAQNDNLTGYGGGPRGNPTLTSSDFLTMQTMQQAGEITLEMNKARRDYLHVRPGTLGASLNAGLFTKD